MDRSAMKKKAKRIVIDNFIKILCIIAIPVIYSFLIQFIISSSFNIAILFKIRSITIMSILINMILTFLISPIIVSLPIFLILDGLQDGFDSINFSSINKYMNLNLILKLVLINLIVGVVTFIGYLFLIVPGIILSYGLHFYIYEFHDAFLAGEDLDIIEILKRSFNNMKGLKFQLFVLLISFILWTLLSSITYHIADIFVVPYMLVAQALFYRYNIK